MSAIEHERRVGPDYVVASEPAIPLRHVITDEQFDSLASQYAQMGLNVERSVSLRSATTRDGVEEYYAHILRTDAEPGDRGYSSRQQSIQEWYGEAMARGRRKVSSYEDYY